MSISASTLTALANSLSALTPAEINLLGGHLTQAEELQAMQVLDNMAANQSTAASLLPQLTAIANVPATVLNWVDQALATPGQFVNYIAQAKNALLSTSISSIL